MSVDIYKLMSQVKNMDVTLVAGKKGLLNTVTWIHMVENIEATTFLEGGELAFTTGFGLNNGQTLLELTECLYNKKAAGLILNIGPFLEKVPAEVIKFGDEHDFPIFIVPWKIHLAEMMRIFSFTILKDSQENLEIAAAFKNAIFFPKQEDLYVIQLSQRGFKINWHYAACVINLNNTNNVNLDSIIMNLNTHMEHIFEDFAIFLHDTEIIVILGNYTSEKLHNFINELTSHLNILLSKKNSYTIGIGKLTKSIRCLYKSYRQAKNIQKLQLKNKIDKSLIFYSEMGIYKLLMNIENQDILNEYYEHSIKPIKEYDEKNNSSLTDVLRCYLKNNGSVKETADELYIQRNKVNYKIKKIEEILNIDLSSLDARVQLIVGFMLEDML